LAASVFIAFSWLAGALFSFIFVFLDKCFPYWYAMAKLCALRGIMQYVKTPAGALFAGGKCAHFEGFFHEP
jgi:hypothetical protein